MWLNARELGREVMIVLDCPKISFPQARNDRASRDKMNLLRIYNGFGEERRSEVMIVLD